MLLLALSIAWASYYISNQLTTKSSVAPNAPTSKPAASIGGECKIGTSICDTKYSYKTCQNNGTYRYTICAGGLECSGGKCVYIYPSIGCGVDFTCITDSVCSGNSLKFDCKSSTGVKGTCCKYIPTPTVSKICTPGVRRCSGNYPQTCNSTGTAWTTGTNCSPRICVTGYCSNAL